MPALNASQTALILIDLQAGILRLPVTPHSAADVVKRAAQLARAVRDSGGTVALVRVAWSSDFRDAPSQIVDQVHHYDIQEDWGELALELDAQPSDIIVTKRQWGAFYGTELDLQLRRRGIRTVIVAGIATNMGVESTARSAWEHGYDVIVADDACSSFSDEMHDFSISTICPMISRIRSTETLIEALS